MRLLLWRYNGAHLATVDKRKSYDVECRDVEEANAKGTLRIIVNLMTGSVRQAIKLKASQRNIYVHSLLNYVI